MSYAHPEYLTWMIPLIALSAWLVRRQRQDERLFESFLSRAMRGRLVQGGGAGAGSRKLGLLLQTLGLALLVVALAGPRWGTDRVPVEHEAADIVFAVDGSRSMQAQDLKPSRMDVARRELSRAVRGLDGNRLGLVGFAGAAYVLSPLTLDGGATELFLEQLQANAIPIQGTSLAEAIRAGARMLPEASHSRSIVLLTDGEDHDGQVLEAAREAAERGIAIHTIGIGGPEGVPIPDPEEGTVRDARGEVVLSRLDEKTLQEIARLTGGSYRRVQSENDTLAGLAARILGKDGRRVRSGYQDRPIPRFQWFVAPGLALLALGPILTRRKEKRP